MSLGDTFDAYVQCMWFVRAYLCEFECESVAGKVTIEKCVRVLQCEWKEWATVILFEARMNIEQNQLVYACTLMSHIHDTLTMNWKQNQSIVYFFVIVVVLLVIYQENSIQFHFVFEINNGNFNKIFSKQIFISLKTASDGESVERKRTKFKLLRIDKIFSFAEFSKIDRMNIYYESWVYFFVV